MFSWMIVLGVCGLALMVLGLLPTFTLPARSARVDLVTNGGAAQPLTVSMTTTSASPDVTAVGSLIGVSVGATVVGTGIPANTTIVAMDDAAHTATLSNNATASGTHNMTVTNPGGELRTQGASFRLFTTNYTPTVNTVLADLTAIEATFDGYAAKTLSMTLGYVDGTSVPYAQSQLLSFIKTAGVNVNDVTGWWIDDGTNVICAGKFNVTVPMATTGAELSGIFQDGYPSGSGWAPLIPAGA